MLCELGLKMPWPIKDRAIYANVAVIVEKDRIHIGLRSNGGVTYLAGKTINKDPKATAVEVTNAAWILHRLGDNKTKFSSYISMDPKCDKIPDWLLNNICKMVAAVFMK